MFRAFNEGARDDVLVLGLQGKMGVYENMEPLK